MERMRDKKSRVVMSHDGQQEWMTVGSVTIIIPGSEPLTVKGGVTVVVTDGKTPDGLREAKIRLRVARLKWLIDKAVLVGFGVALGRALPMLF